MKNAGKLKLTKRMDAVAGLIKSETVCEIGCDHGKILASVAMQGNAEKAIFAEISAKCLDKAKRLAGELQLKNCEFVVSDGLENIREDALDCVIIAGMGGREIAKILSHPKADNIKKICGQPNKDVVYLRQHLIKNGFKIEKDFVVEDAKKFYSIIFAQRGSDNLSKEEELLGRTNLKEKSGDFMRYVAAEIKKYEFILQHKQDENLQEKLKMLKGVIE